MATENFINECKNRANANRLGKFDLKSSNILEAEGSNITLNDVYSLKSLELNGDTYQQTYTGKNLFDLNDIKEQSTGITVDDDDWITITGNNSSGSSTLFRNYYTNKTDRLKVNTTYKVICEIKSKTGTIRDLTVTSNAAASQANTNNIIPNADITNNKVIVRNFTTKSDFSNCSIMLRTYVAFSPGNNGSVTFRISVVEDTSITPETFIYEPYVGGIPSPNPDYPQEIQSVTGLQKVNVCGKNLCFNVTKPSNANLKFFINKSISKTFTISFTTNEALNGNSLYLEVDGTGYGNLGGITASANTKVEKTYTLSDANYQAIKNGTNIDLLLYKNGANFNIPDDGMVENNSTATEYEPYKGNTYEVNLVKENVFNFDNYATKSANVEIVSQTEDTLVATVNQATTWQTIRYNINNLKKNTDYSFKFDFENTYTSDLYKHTWITIRGEDGNNIYNEPYYKDDIIKFNTGNSTTIGFSFHVTINSPAVVNTITINNVKLQENIELNKIGDYEDSIKKSTGKNLCNSKTINSYAGSTGNINTSASNQYLGVEDKIVVEPNTTYTITFFSYDIGSFNYATYDKNGDFIERITNTSKTFTTGNNVHYIFPYLYQNSGPFTVIDTYVQLEQGSVATDYEPYLSKGTWYIEKKAGSVVLDGTETGWFKSGTSSYNSYGISSDYTGLPTITSNSMCSHFIYATSNRNNSYWYGNNNLYLVFPLSSEVNTLALFKTWLGNNKPKLDYVLASPTYTEITNEELINQLESIKLLKGLNNIAITSGDLSTPIEIQAYDTEYIDQSNKLVSMEFKDSCCINNEILGSIYTKSADVKLLDLPINTELEGQTITPEVGVKYNDNTTEYETFDDYVIESLSDEQTASNTKFTAMNGSTLLDKEYECSLSFENDTTHTISEFYQDACNQIGLTPTDTSFDNSTIVMTGNPFTNRETIRTVISEVEKVSCSIAKFDWKNKTISLTWLSDQIDYEFNTSDYSTLEGSLTQYGPLNVIIIGNSQLNGENVTMTDSESVAVNGEHQIMIDSPYFLYTEALRTQAIQAIYNKLDGLTYYDIKLTTPYGKPFLEIGNKIRINTNENQVYDTYVLSHTFKYDGTFNSVIESPALTTEEQTIKNEFKGNSVREKLRRTELMVDKTTGDITAITDRVTTVENEFGDVYSKEEVNTLIQNSATGLTNNFINSGGNNILRNTGLWFEDRSDIEYLYPESSLYPSDELFMKADPHWEYWKGNAEKVKEEKASNMSGILLKTGYFEQQQQVRNGTYTLSFKYRKLLQVANISVQINDKRIDLTNTQDTEVVEVIEVTSQFIDLIISSDADDGCVIYDLMINAGSEKAEYSQHQNETTTDTVNISKGITISSSDTNTTFKANSDGIRVYNSKDMDSPVVDFTDTGMNTNRIKAKEEAEIVEVLFKNVGNNTWITRL